MKIPILIIIMALLVAGLELFYLDISMIHYSVLTASAVVMFAFRKPFEFILFRPFTWISALFSVSFLLGMLSYEGIKVLIENIKKFFIKVWANLEKTIQDYFNDLFNQKK